MRCLSSSKITVVIKSSVIKYARRGFLGRSGPIDDLILSRMASKFVLPFILLACCGRIIAFSNFKNYKNDIPKFRNLFSSKDGDESVIAQKILQNLNSAQKDNQAAQDSHLKGFGSPKPITVDQVDAKKRSEQKKKYQELLKIAKKQSSVKKIVSSGKDAKVPKQKRQAWCYFLEPMKTLKLF